MDDLTPRELQVLKLVCEGHSTNHIARELGITAKTVACHRYRIFDKVGVRNAVGLLRSAIRAGIVNINPQDVATLAAAAAGHEASSSVISGPHHTQQQLSAELGQARSRYLEASREFLKAMDDVPSGAPHPDGALRVKLLARNRQHAFADYRSVRKKLALEADRRSDPP